MSKEKVVLSWSSGKDSAWALYTLRTNPNLEVIALLTTITDEYDRVSIHGVRESLLERQAEAVRIPLWKVKIPKVCSNSQYEEKMKVAQARATEAGAKYIAFGDLFLEDIRDYRIKNLKGTGLEPLFPLWKIPTPPLAREMISSGLKAVITCIDTKKLSQSFCGREFDGNLLEDLPANIDLCGENGEFHTFAYDGPMFEHPILIEAGETVVRENFCFKDFSEKIRY